MSSKLPNCHITLHGMTTLKNRRELPGKANMFVYDGLFSCAEQTGEDDDGIGSFRHYVGRNTRLKRDGTYDIHAKVGTFSLMTTTTVHNMRQIAGHQTGRNIASDDIPDDMVNVLGDIRLVRRPVHVQHNCFRDHTIPYQRCNRCRTATKICRSMMTQ